MQEVLLFHIHRQSQSHSIIHEGLPGGEEDCIYVCASPSMWCDSINMESISCPPLASETRSRTNCSGNADDAATCRLWALSWTVCERWRCSPAICCIHHRCMRCHKRGDEMHAYCISLRGRPFSSDRRARRSSQENREEQDGEWVPLYRHASVIIQWASRQRGCVFMKTATSTSPRLSPRCKSSSWKELLLIRQSSNPSLILFLLLILSFTVTHIIWP